MSGSIENEIPLRKTVKALPLCVMFDGGGYQVCEPAEATHVRLDMPGPSGTVIIPVMIKGRREGTYNWTWNGDVDKPTLRPSLCTEGVDSRGWKPGAPKGPAYTCHTWVTDGQAIFLPDSTHELAGQTLDLKDIDINVYDKPV